MTGLDVQRAWRVIMGRGDAQETSCVFEAVSETLQVGYERER